VSGKWQVTIGLGNGLEFETRLPRTNAQY